MALEAELLAGLAATEAASPRAPGPAPAPAAGLPGDRSCSESIAVT